MPRVVSNGGVTTVTGSESVAITSLASGYVTAEIDLNPAINPILGRWLGRQATLYNKYKFVRATLRHVPFCATSQGGKVTIGWCADPSQEISTDGSQTEQFQNAISAPVWREVSCNYKQPRTLEFTIDSLGISNPDVSPGKFIVSTGYGTAPVETPAAVGTLYLDYSVQFWDRTPFQSN